MLVAPCAALWKWSRLTRVFAAIKNAGCWGWIAEKWAAQKEGWGGALEKCGKMGIERVKNCNCSGSSCLFPLNSQPSTWCE